MSYWLNVKTVLEEVFHKATGVSFLWNDEPRKMLRRPFGLLALGQSLSVGNESSGYTFRDSNVRLYLYGHRELTINIQIFSSKSKGDNSARNLIEKARLALANPIFRDELRSAGLVFVENHPVYQQNEICANFDVVFRLLRQQQYGWKKKAYFEAVDINKNIL